MSISHVPSATRTLRVLRYLASRPQPATLESISRACDLPRSTAYHLLNTMIAEGFVTHLAEQHRFALDLGAYEAGSGYVRQDPLLQTAGAPMAALCDRLCVSVYLALPYGREVVFVAESRAPTMPPLLQRPTQRLPARCTSPGLALLAALPQDRVRGLYPGPDAFVDERPHDGPIRIDALEKALAVVRQQGFATSPSQAAPGFQTLAAIIPGGPTGARAALEVTYRPDARLTVPRLAPEVMRAAGSIGAMLTARLDRL